MPKVVKGGRVVTAANDFMADVLVDGGSISAIGEPGAFDYIADAEVFDAAGKLVLPGGVDPHTHLDTPAGGSVVSDDFESGTIAAAVGGTTTVVDFPIQDKGEDPRSAVDRWFAKAEGRTAVDWAFHPIITDLDETALTGMNHLIAHEGITSFKLFMAYPGVWMLDDGAIFTAMRRTADTGGFILLHCENGLAIDVLVREAVAQGRTEPHEHAVTRPSLAEGEATSRAVRLAEIAGVPVYVVHLSAVEALDAVREGRDRGVKVYAETCPHYLLLTDERLSQPDFGGAPYVCSPPLRPAHHLPELWRGLASDDLQVVATDHAPFMMKDKRLGEGDFSKIPNGMPGVEWRIQLLYDQGVRTGRLSLSRFVEVTATNPAKLFGLHPKKGELAPGSDADIVIFDPERSVTLSHATQVTRCDTNPYEGWNVTGGVDTVLLRGEEIVRGGRYTGRGPSGQFVRMTGSAALR